MKTNIIVTLFVIVLVAVGIFFAIKSDNAPGKYDEFASCLEEKGAKFYGAFWCPHCKAQKELFGNSAKKLPYVECSTADASAQTAICQEKKIESYPTWIFADESRVTGEQSFEELAAKTQCALPVDEAAPAAN
jgi:thiol-disulfide isomerase/thioredoxin